MLVDVLLQTSVLDCSRATEMIRAAGGMRGKIREWRLGGFHTENTGRRRYGSHGELDGTRVAAALTASDPSPDALNVFGSGGVTLRRCSPLCSRRHRRIVFELRVQSIASVRGPQRRYRQGLELITGAEWREESVSYDMAPPANVSGSHQRSIAAAFGELRLPLLDASAQVPAVHYLAVVLSGRLDDYSDVGQSFNPRVFADLATDIGPDSAHITDAKLPAAAALRSLHAPCRCSRTNCGSGSKRRIHTPYCSRGRQPGLEAIERQFAQHWLRFGPSHMHC